MNHFINLKDIPANDLRNILIDAKKRKIARKKLDNLEIDKGAPLKGKLLIQMFEKSSLRTRLSFYLAIKQLGGSTLTLRPDELHLSKGGESIEDTAKILSNFGNAFMLRTDNDQKLEEFKKHLSIPIINGLSPSSHATQVLSDVFTVEEIKKKPISKLKISWIGDSNNVLNSLIAASVKFSFELNIGCPKNYHPDKNILSYIKNNSDKIFLHNDAKTAALGADVIFSDKVISMNDKVNKTKKISHFKNFRINKKLMSFAKKDCIFLHCLPRGKEVDEDVFASKNSKVWQQALNRVHVQKSILLYCFDTPEIKYHKLLERCVSQIKKHLNLEITVVTNIETFKNISPLGMINYKLVENSTTNNRPYRGKSIAWYNKERSMAYDHSPYDTTILMDCDYFVFDNTLDKIFDTSQSMCSPIDFTVNGFAVNFITGSIGLPTMFPWPVGKR